MSDSRSTSSTSDGRQPSRGRGMSYFGQSRRPPARPPFQTPSAPHYPSSAPSSSHENRSATSTAAPPFQGHPPQYTYGQRGAYVGQYTMSAQPPMGMVHHSPPQYAYPPPHPGLHAHDQSMLTPPQNQLMGYSPSTLMPMMQTHSPVYQYPGQSPEGSSSPSHSFSTTHAVFPTHPRSQTLPSPPPQSPLAPPASGPPHGIPTTLPPAHSSSYAGQAPYSPMRGYSTPPFSYPPHSFAPSPPLYTSQYPTYTQPYPQPGVEQETQGTWWYLPPHPGSGQYESFQSPYAMSYSPANVREVEQHQHGPFTSSPVATAALPASSTGASARSSAAGGSTLHPAPYSPSVQSPQPTVYGQTPPDDSQPLQQGRPPDPGPSAPPMSPSSASSQPSADRPSPARRPYHPNPPAHRSEWVMWAGNVPSDATHDELWRFFNSPPTPGSSTDAQSAGAQSTQSAPAGPIGSSTTPSTASTESVHGGVSSIFLISRSNCAFVNFRTEIHLQAAIRHFNGVPLRADDPRCPRLVCRVRGREDDLKSGVGGQRGAGLHVRWVKEKKEREKEAARRRASLSGASTSSEQVTTPSSSPTEALHRMGGLSISSDEEGGLGHRPRKPAPHSSSSGSYASTNSGFLTTYFPKRYFILKSLTPVISWVYTPGGFNFR